MEANEQEYGGEFWVEGDEITGDTTFDEAGETVANLLDQAFAADPETAAQEFERLVDASDAQVARAMHNIIKGGKDADTKQRSTEQGDIAEAADQAESRGAAQPVAPISEREGSGDVVLQEDQEGGSQQGGRRAGEDSVSQSASEEQRSDSVGDDTRPE